MFFSSFSAFPGLGMWRICLTPPAGRFLTKCKRLTWARCLFMLHHGLQSPREPCFASLMYKHFHQHKHVDLVLACDTLLEAQTFLQWDLSTTTLINLVAPTSCAFAGQKPVRIDNRRCVPAWTAFVRGEAFPNTANGSWCHQVQPPDYGFLLAHCPAPPARADSDGQPDFWVGKLGVGSLFKESWVWCVAVWSQESIWLARKDDGVSWSPPSFGW